MYVLVLDHQKQPLMPCHPARARQLLKTGKAAVYRCYPFTLILKEREGGEVQALEAKIDPGSKTTGIVLLLEGKRNNKVIWAAHLNHRGKTIRSTLGNRRALRRGRRARHTRYRAARFNNRTRPKGWLAPSLNSRVNNVVVWVKRLKRYAPLAKIAVESVRFDTQQLQNPEISGIEYQQGTLFGYEVREYLLEKWQRTCAYCDVQNVPLEVEHIVPKSKGGSNSVSNLTLACRVCNIKKGNLSLEVFLKDKLKLNKITQYKHKSLTDAAAVNTTRLALISALKQLSIPLSTYLGGQTKYNRVQQGYPKTHWVDAACVGKSGEKVYLPKTVIPCIITAMSRGTRQMCRVNQYGFPRTSAKSQKQVGGFKTGDLVKAHVTKGKKCGFYIGRVAVRTSGNFNIKTASGTIEGIHYRYCKPLHRSDGYNYFYGGGVSSSC